MLVAGAATKRRSGSRLAANLCRSRRGVDRGRLVRAWASDGTAREVLRLAGGCVAVVAGCVRSVLERVVDVGSRHGNADRSELVQYLDRVALSGEYFA